MRFRQATLFAGCDVIIKRNKKTLTQRLISIVNSQEK